MDEDEAVLPSSSATSVRKKKGNSQNRDQQRKRGKNNPGSLLQTQTDRKRSVTEEYIIYGLSLCSGPEVFRVRCFS